MQEYALFRICVLYGMCFSLKVWKRTTKIDAKNVLLQYKQQQQQHKNTVKNGHNIETNAALHGWCIDIIDTNDYNNA